MRAVDSDAGSVRGLAEEKERRRGYMEGVREFRGGRRERDGWFLEDGRKERREEEENANCCGNDVKEANGKKRR